MESTNQTALMRIDVTLLVLLVLTSVGCQRGPGRRTPASKPSPPVADPERPIKEGGAGREVESTPGIVNEADMIRLLSSRLPAGTPLEMARAFMEREGFKCSLTTNGHFGDRKAIDYLYCTRSEDSGMALVDRRWLVAIIHESGQVVEIDASTGLVGL